MDKEQAIEKLNDIRCHVKETSAEEQALVMAIDALKQPVATDTNVGDTIIRQAAIDAIEKMNIPDDMCVFEILSHIEVEIATLPSAQPETAKRIVGKSRDGMTLWYQCDMCDEPVDEQDNYCRGCGRRLIDG